MSLYLSRSFCGASSASCLRALPAIELDPDGCANGMTIILKPTPIHNTFHNHSPSRISCFAFWISARISRTISLRKLSSSCGVASDNASPFTCFRIVSSLALPKRLRDGRGDSEPLFDELPPPLAFCEADDGVDVMALAFDEPSLCGSVLDFSHWRRPSSAAPAGCSGWSEGGGGKCH